MKSKVMGENKKNKHDKLQETSELPELGIIKIGYHFITIFYLFTLSTALNVTVYL